MPKMYMMISSVQNPRVKNTLLLEEKASARKEQERFVAEGTREISLALQAGFDIVQLYFCPDLLVPAVRDELFGKLTRSTEILEVTRDVFNRLAYRKDHGGAIAVARPRRLHFTDLALRHDPLLLILETVEKPGNLGALLRTADAAGLDAVVICDPQTDLYNPNTIRSAIGCVFTLPIVTATTSETLGWLRGKGIRSYATALTATAFYHHADYAIPCAIVMGSEAYGLSDAWLEGADRLIRIPMLGKIDSMNVSASAAIVVFEALRQRGFSH